MYFHPFHPISHCTAFRKCVHPFVCCLHLQVKLSVIFDYARSVTWYMAFLIFFFNVLSNGLSVGGNFWLAGWSDREDGKGNISGAETCVMGEEES